MTGWVHVYYAHPFGYTLRLDEVAFYVNKIGDIRLNAVFTHICNGNTIARTVTPLYDKLAANTRGRKAANARSRGAA